MIRRNHIHILDVLSVLLFSLLASFIFTLEIDFKKQLDLIALTKLIFISLSTFIFYFMVDELKKIITTATDEYNDEEDKAKKAAKSIDDRYLKYYKKEQSKINFQIFVSILFFVLFFLFEAIVKYFK